MSHTEKRVDSAMNTMVPWPDPSHHTDAIRDLQERFQILERNLTRRLEDFFRHKHDEYEPKHNTPDMSNFNDYDYSQEEPE